MRDERSIRMPDDPQMDELLRAHSWVRQRSVPKARALGVENSRNDDVIDTSAVWSLRGREGPVVVPVERVSVLVVVKGNHSWISCMLAVRSRDELLLLGFRE